MENLSIQKIKLQAGRVTERLKSLGLNIKHTQALEVVAAVHNFPDWNRLKASLDSKTIKEHSQSDTPHRILILQPGTGKSFSMGVLFGNQIKVSSFNRDHAGIPIYIECSESGPPSWWPQSILNETSKITARFDIDGNICSIDKPDANCKGIWIGFNNSEARSADLPLRWRINAKSLLNLIFHIRDNWPVSIKHQIGLILIDEFSCVDETYPELLETVLPNFAGEKAKLVIATQFIPDLTPFRNSPLRFKFISSENAVRQLANMYPPAETGDFLLVDRNDVIKSDNVVDAVSKIVFQAIKNHRDEKFIMSLFERSMENIYSLASAIGSHVDQ